MGGSGGTFRAGKSPSDIASSLMLSIASDAAQFEVQLASELSGLLAKFNARDTAETAERLESIKEVLHNEINGSFDTFFGGSVAKHTFVDGISDVDSMLIVGGKLADASPHEILRAVERALTEKMAPSGVGVTAGNVAVTVTYPDGKEIQLVPCVAMLGGKLKVPAWDANTWSRIDPRQFRDGLTKRNEECAGKLIPTLKLAKAVNATLPEGARLSGYHIESIGVAAFRGYDDEKTTVRMLPHFFKQASRLVLSPMTDRTGQSVHVDENLGPSNSESRRSLSHVLSRIHQRMLNASAAGSRDRWMEILGE